MGDLSLNFNRKEFACKCGCGFDTVDHGLVVILEDVRRHFEKPIKINSGCRCRAHNEAEGGSNGSQHTKGRAVDFVVSGVNPDLVAVYLARVCFGRYGIGQYNGRTHVDSRTNGPARWDKR